MGRRLRKVLRIGLALGAGLGLSAGVGELIVRQWFPEPILPRFVIDAGYGVRDNETLVDTVHSAPGEYNVAIHTNASGLRGQREFPRSKPPGAYRIALLGDSFVFGYGVEDDEVVSTQLARLLAPHAPAGRTIEVLNFGVAGFGQAEESLIYDHKVRAYGPDLVVLFYFDNDIGNDAVSGLYRVDDGGQPVRTELDYLPGVRAREVLYSVPPIRWLFEHSQLWNLVRNRASAVVQGRLLAHQGMQKFNDETHAGLTLHRAIFSALLQTIRSDGAETAVFVIPQNNMQSNFAFSADELAPAVAFVLDGREFLSAQDYYARDGHWRPSGHLRAAERLAESIRNLPDLQTEAVR